MKNQTFSTSDLGLASSLVAIGYKIITLERSNFARVNFVFRDEPAVERDVKNYWNNTLRVSARALIESQKMLKTRIYNN